MFIKTPLITAAIGSVTLWLLAASPQREDVECGMPPPIPTPVVRLLTPQDNADNVSPLIGTASVSAPTGTGFALIARSRFEPLKLEQIKIRTHASGNPWALVLPRLDAATTYEIVYGYSDWQSTSPCFNPILIKVGLFKTGT